MTAADRLEAARAQIATPMGAWLNMSAARGEDGLVFRLGFDERHIGNPAIRALHGGAIAAFLELAAEAELAARLGARARSASFSIDYLTSSRAEDMFGRARILRAGRRIAVVDAEGWQSDPLKPVATARICLRIGATSVATGGTSRP